MSMAILYKICCKTEPSPAPASKTNRHSSGDGHHHCHRHDGSHRQAWHRMRISPKNRKIAPRPSQNIVQQQIWLSRAGIRYNLLHFCNTSAAKTIQDKRSVFDSAAKLSGITFFYTLTLIPSENYPGSKFSTFEHQSPARMPVRQNYTIETKRKWIDLRKNNLNSLKFHARRLIQPGSWSYTFIR